MSHDLPVAVTEERGRVVELNETCRVVGLRIRVGATSCCLVTDGHSDVDVIFTSLT